MSGVVYWCSVNTPIGPVYLARTSRGLVAVSIGDYAAFKSKLGRFAQTAVEAPERLADAVEQLTEYLNRRRRMFSVPLDLRGTSFQVRVWRAVVEIPYGEVRSYTWVAHRVGSPRAVRAVGRALARNPIPIFVPCHRVIRSDGRLGGYSCGVRVKEYLLKLEGVCVARGMVAPTA